MLCTKHTQKHSIRTTSSKQCIATIIILQASLHEPDPSHCLPVSCQGVSLSWMAGHSVCQSVNLGASLAGIPIHEDHREAFSNLGLMQQHASSSDPHWTQSDQSPRKRNLRNMNSTVSTDGLSDIALSEGGTPMAGAHANGHVSPAGLPLAGTVICHVVCFDAITVCLYPIVTVYHLHIR